MPRAPSSDPSHELADRLHSLAIHLLRRLRRVDEATGLSAPSLSALSVLVFGGPRTHGELADAEQVRPPTMTRVVKDLDARGLIRRRPDPNDGRVVRLEATAAGKRLLGRGRSRRVAELAKRLDALSAKDQRSIEHALRALKGVVARWEE